MIAIIGAMDQEVAWLKANLTGLSTASQAGFEFHSGQLAGKDVVVLQCGIGKVNAAVGCALLLAQYKPEAVINTGSAGGLLATQEVGDVVVSTGMVYHDVNVTIFGYKMGQVPKMPAVFEADAALIRRAEAAIELQNVRHSRGLLASGDSFMHEPERIQAVRDDFPGVCGVEMEGAAIAHTCHLFGTPWVVIRALSDIAGKESPMVFADFLPLASKNSSAIIVQMLKNW